MIFSRVDFYPRAADAMLTGCPTIKFLPWKPAKPLNSTLISNLVGSKALGPNAKWEEEEDLNVQNSHYRLTMDCRTDGRTDERCDVGRGAIALGRRATANAVAVRRSRWRPPRHAKIQI